ncbi:PREDICTED: melanotransferrin isoform X1 [Chinchilla lanigera]|uniref:melanotransferrin isoform X1 n=1 Tax=Chinchilla lanigera TaxID=34839 RepID=UPI000698FDD2|nr:PREDICTED: melanotransferrin isoform X1 [Chinchilla lanigera]
MRGALEALWLLLCLRAALFGEQVTEVRWCTISDAEQLKCENMSKAFREARIQPFIACVQGTSGLHCMQLISARKADAITLDGEAIYEAGREHGLKPVVGELYDGEVGTSYYAVAVVRKNSSITINTLKGVKSCHTGLQRTAGWNVPVGFLVETGRLSVMGCDVLTAVSEFFGGSCVPGAGETNHSLSLCRACRGDGSGKRVCDNSPLERYYGYSGAFRCLAEGAGDVAFVRHGTVLENTDGKTLPSWGKALLSQDFELLCRNGRRASVTEWRRCHLARVPAQAVVVRADMDGKLIFRLLGEGQLLFNQKGSTFQMFSSESYGQKDLLFKDATVELVPIATQTYEAWLGHDYLHAMRGLFCDPNQLPHLLRWCVLSTPEFRKCGDMAMAFNQQKLKPEIQCVWADSPLQCMRQIQAGHIDAVTLKGEDIYRAGKMFGLVPAAGESYAENSSISYYAVALVRRDSSSAFTLNELRGKRSCHSSVDSLAGWTVPVGALTHRGSIQPRDCNVIRGVSEFFNGSCVPGSEARKYPPSLCAVCVGDEKGRNKCVANSQERYFSDSGAFRCLVEKAGDVAFVKHTTVFDNTNAEQTPGSSQQRFWRPRPHFFPATLSPGHAAEPWAAELRQQDYQLLCPNGARAEVHQFQACSLAKIPAHAVMVRPDTNAFSVYGLLDKAQELYGDDDNKNGFQMFDSYKYRGQDLLFQDITVQLVPVAEKSTYLAWLGPDYVSAMDGILTPPCSGPVTVPRVSRLLLLLLTAGLVLPSTL